MGNMASWIHFAKTAAVQKTDAAGHEFLRFP